MSGLHISIEVGLHCINTYSKNCGIITESATIWRRQVKTNFVYCRR